MSEKTEECIFCEKPKQNKDRENLILYRAERSFILMNLYPYNNGHLMVAPYAHAHDIEELDSETLLEVMTLTRRLVRLMKRVMRPEGFNIGFNQGQVAGAGIHEHLHLHIVPRWLGDVNMMPVLADTRVISQHIEETYDALLEGMKKMPDDFPEK
ncbi:MAG: HIT domain-containing protein [bacterium]